MHPLITIDAVAAIVCQRHVNEQITWYCTVSTVNKLNDLRNSEPPPSLIFNSGHGPDWGED